MPGGRQLPAPGSINSGAPFGVVSHFHVSEHTRIQFRAEMFNARHRDKFGNPGTSLGGPNFGTINSVNAARIVQLGMELYL